MRAGQRNAKVEIQYSTETINALGESIETWSLYIAAWAEVQTSGGRETLRAMQQIADLSHVLTIRYISGITSKMRVVLTDGTILEIVAPPYDPSGRKQDMRLYCSELIL